MEPVIAPPGSSPVDELIASLETPAQRADTQTLVELFSDLSGQPAVLWSGRIIGFGEYHYRYESGHQGDSPALGFSPRKGKFALYGLLAEDGAESLLPALGKHRRGVSCLYVNRLADVDIATLGELARRGYAHTMKELHRP
ncbi:DUF1801 domain-containing protein [Arthrobacter sp. NPDC090010]|uniref:DUF1801 domain-containing protein n=1 Tax=Arthrobacter sp. NPDC090010 TaxID=3363942 RepID=UPI0038248D29